MSKQDLLINEIEDNNLDEVKQLVASGLSTISIDEVVETKSKILNLKSIKHVLLLSELFSGFVISAEEILFILLKAMKCATFCVI